jgi:glycosyltransferase involved in cell wall biosynthesis
MNTWQAYIQTSFYEGHPKSVVEAMSCGLPVIGSRVRGIEHVLDHGNTGWLSGTDADEIGQALERVMGDDALRQKLGNNAREYVLENYALPHIVERELQIIQEIAR